MDYMTLTKAEHARFLQWLEQEAISSKAILPQVEAMKHQGELAKRLKAEIVACNVLMAKLHMMEDMATE